MNPADRYHLVVYWSDEDQSYVGLCPDLFYGGTHGDDPEQVFKDLRAIVADVVESYKAEGKPLPEPRSHHRFTYTRERPTTRKCRLSNRA